MSRLIWAFAGHTLFCWFWYVLAQINMSRQKQQNDLCAQQRLRSAWNRPVWSEPSPLWVAKNPNFLQADSGDSDQTGRMPRLIWVFTGHTSLCWFCRVMAHISPLYCLSKYFQIIMHYFKWDCSHCWLVYLLIVNKYRYFISHLKQWWFFSWHKYWELVDLER